MAENGPKEISGKPYGDYDRHKKLVHFGYSFGGFILTAIVDYLFLWPENHLTALLAIAAWLSVTAIVELTVWDFPPRVTAGAVIGLFGIAVVANSIIGPNLPVETDIHGWLLPANEATPANGCDRAKATGHLPNNTLLFLLGSNGYGVTANGKSKVLTVGSCAIMFVERDGAQLGLDADIFDESGELIARIERNEFHLVPGKYAYQTRSQDRSILTVYDKRAKKLLGVHYLNRTAVQIEGTITCGDKTSIVAGNSGPVTLNSPMISNGQITDACGWNAAGFVFTAQGMGL